MGNWVKELGNNLVIVDTSNLAFRYFKNPQAMEFGLPKTIQSFKMSYQAYDAVALFDFGKSTYRQALYKDRDDDYKGNRDKIKAERTEEEKEASEAFFEAQEAAAEALEAAGIVVIREYGLEADDIAAYLCKKYYDTYDNIKLISTDKDWLQLLNDKVTCFAYVQQQERDVEWLKATYNCTPSEFLRALILSGDKSDNIPGITGLGEPKNDKARSLTWAKRADTFEGIVDIASKTKGVIAQRVANSLDTMLFAEKLVDLSQPNIITEEQKIRIEEKLCQLG